MRRLLAPVVSFAFVSLITTAASAQEEPPLDEFSVLRFTPAPGPGNFLSTEGATIGGHLVPSAGLTLEYAHRPFSLYGAECDAGDTTNCDTTGELRRLVSYYAAGHVSGSISVVERLQIGLVVPVVLASGQSFSYSRPSEGDFEAIQGGRAFGVGDGRFSVKGRFFGEGDEGLAFGGSVFVTFPIGQATTSDHAFIGENSFTAGGQVIGEFRQRGVHLAGNVGAVYRPTATLFSTRVGSQLTYDIALGYDVTPLIQVFAELEGASSFTAEVDENPLEGRLAGRYTMGDISFTLGAGAGLISGVGIPVFRALGQVQYAPVRGDADGDGIDDRDDACPSEPEDLDGYQDEDGCPDEDNDGDGFADADDRCPDEPEDRDGHEDEDGCPDADNDGDGIPDGYDSCPADPEDMDGDRDEDGCPDNDTDRDGIEDPNDQCPDEAEDTDGFADDDGCPEDDVDGDGVPDDRDECPEVPETINGVEDEDGCPEEDSDGDGIVDAVDRCPNDPETFNGVNDDDGCPDGQALVEVQGEQIRLLQQVQFRTNSADIRGVRSRRILDAVATILQRNPQYRRIRVEGHTDDRGNDERNMELSQARAQSCIDALVSRGISADRLHALGKGETAPIAANQTPAGREQNRRTEFHIEAIGLQIQSGMPAAGTAPAPTEAAPPASE
jgi:outer membrane protein OmpA-like peptidoglycan-associated protein